MADRLSIWRCPECGLMVEVLNACNCEGCDITCCGTALEELEANTRDAATEKHVPVIEKTEKGFKVTVGSVPHPMAEDHFIEFIEVIADGKVYRKFLKPGDAPEACFKLCAESIVAREHCNLHGLWEASA